MNAIKLHKALTQAGADCRILDDYKNDLEHVFIVEYAGNFERAEYQALISLNGWIVRKAGAVSVIAFRRWVQK